MADGLRSMRWRAAIMLVGAGLVLAWVVGFGQTTYIIQIDWSWGQHVLEGAKVEIDGDSVGVLTRYGRSQTVTGFEVEPGEHTVRVIYDDCVPDEETVTLSSSGSRLEILMAEHVDDYTCRVSLW